jgi:hypothetical protein
MCKHEASARVRGGTNAKLVNVGIVADPSEILSDTLAERDILDVGVLMAKVMRATDVETGEGGQTAKDGETRRRLPRA